MRGDRERAAVQAEEAGVCADGESRVEAVLEVASSRAGGAGRVGASGRAKGVARKAGVLSLVGWLGAQLLMLALWCSWQTAEAIVAEVMETGSTAAWIEASTWTSEPSECESELAFEVAFSMAAEAIDAGSTA